MARLVWLLALAACEPAESPRPAARPPAPRDAAVDATRVADAAPPDAPPDAPPWTELHGMRMHGPEKSLYRSCMTIAPCGGTVYNAKTGEITHPPAEPDCSALDRDPNLQPDAPDTLAIRDMRIASIQCATPHGMRGSESRYHLFMQRADGWWRSDEVFELAYNEHYCGGDVSATWSRRGARELAHVHAGQTCLGCGKTADDEQKLELLLAVETTGDIPTLWGPVIVGESEEIKPAWWGPDPDDERLKTCDFVHRRVRLDERWTDDDTFVLSGPATWQAFDNTNGAMLPFFASAHVPSTLGTYKLVP